MSDCNCNWLCMLILIYYCFCLAFLFLSASSVFNHSFFSFSCYFMSLVVLYIILIFQQEGSGLDLDGWLEPFCVEYCVCSPCFCTGFFGLGQLATLYCLHVRKWNKRFKYGRHLAKGGRELQEGLQQCKGMTSVSSLFSNVFFYPDFLIPFTNRLMTMLLFLQTSMFVILRFFSAITVL